MNENKEYNGILIISEENLGSVHKVSYELLYKANLLVEKLGSEINCLLLTHNDLEVNKLIHCGADKVYIMKDPSFENADENLFAKNIVPFIEKHKPEIVLFGATNLGRSLAPRIAAALKTGLTADCTELELDDENKLIQIRPAFSDNLLAHIKTVKYPQMATVRYKEFKEATPDIKRTGEIEKIKPFCNEIDSVMIDEVHDLSEVDITDAEVIVAGGRGIRKKEDLDLLAKLANILGGTVGVSRALVDAGMETSSKQVGYSGNRVKPKVYIACGISGAPQHLAGMKESDIIIAINSDPSAPIFGVANYGYIGDLYEVVPTLIEKWNKGAK